MTIQASSEQATRNKDDATTALTDAEKELETAKNAPVDVTVEERALSDAKNDLQSKKDAELAANRALIDAPDDQKPVFQTALTAAQREREDAQTVVDRANATLVAKKAAERDVTAQEQKVAQAKQTLKNADLAITTATRNKTDAEKDLASVTKAQEAPLASAKKAADDAKALRAAIATAGAKLLYAQPHDPKRDIYKGKKINPKLASNGTVASRVNRLRLVGFPEFSSTSFTQGDLSALVPIEAMAFGINISSTNISKVSVKVPAAESYGISIDKLMKKIFKSDGSDLTDDFKNMADIGHAVTGYAPTDKQTVFIRIFTEVFYARALDVSIFSAKSFGAKAQLSAPTTLIGAQTTTSEASNVPSMTATPLDTSTLGSSTAAAMLASTQARIGATRTVPGGSVQMVSHNEKSVGLRRVFDRPIAIGVRGITIEYDHKKRELVGITTINSSVASALEPPMTSE